MLKQINSYNVLELIGSGGMGEVYKVNHLLRDEIYAIKSLHSHFCRDDEFRIRFFNEAKIMSKLNDRNIVKVYDYLDHEGGLFIVMEYVQGKPLSKIIGKETGPIPHEKAIPLFKQIISGIKHAHHSGIIHRDIKPANMILDTGGVIKITDFGIAKMEDAVGFTATGTKLGTVSYMSPEQIEGKNVNRLSDIYSLGITLYEMLAGRQPFKVENTASQLEQSQLIIRIMSEPISDPRTIYPHIPEAYVSIIKKATEKQQANRIQSIDEFERLINEAEKALNFNSAVYTAHTDFTEPTYTPPNNNRNYAADKLKHQNIPRKNNSDSISIPKSSLPWIISIAGVVIFFALVLIIISANDKPKNNVSKPEQEISGNPNTGRTQTEPNGNTSNIDNRHQNIPGEYPQASSRYLSSDEVAVLAKYELNIMRNEIFARYGYIFKSDDLRMYFSNKSWYTPRYADVGKYLTTIELANIKLILSYEK